MLQSNDWTVPRYLGAVFPDKPPMLFWLQAASMSILGDNAGAARLPSAVATFLTLVVLSGTVWKTAGPRHGWWTALVYITSCLVIVAGKTCLTDALLVLWVTIGQLGLYAAYVGRANNWTRAAMWIAVGLGVLTKLPVIVAVLGITAIVLAVMDALSSGRSLLVPTTWWTASRWWWRTRPWLGIPIAAAIVAPWVYRVFRASKESIIQAALRHDVWERFTRPLEGHSGPPGYYLVATLVCFIPWVVLLPLVLHRAFKNRHQPPIRFALAAVIGPWLMFEVASTKLPAYVLPVYPALAFLTADFIVRCLRGQYPDLRARIVRYGAIAAIAIVLLLAAAPWVPMVPSFRLDPGPVWALAVTSFAALFAGVLVVGGFLGAWRARGSELGWVGAGMIGLTIVLAGVYLPHANFLQMSRQIGKSLHDQGGSATAPGQQVMVGYDEPSLAFYQGGAIRRPGDGRYLLDTPPEQWKDWLVVSRRVWDKIPQDQKDKSGLVVLRMFRGWNYSAHGRLDEVIVLGRTDPNPLSAPSAAGRR
jgi:4-amino-4-deoxy-L-arabinose transferase-like glycosyltransferase